MAHDHPVLIVGANRGIGLALTDLGRARGPIVATCRTPSPGLEKLGVHILDGVDVTDAASVRGLAGRAPKPLGGIVVNAGKMGRDSLGGLDFDSLREQFEINALGPLRVVEALVHHLAPGGFVAVITSRMGSIADNGRGGAYGYRMSKAAVNAAGVSLARDLAPKGHPVVLLHPGWVKTDLTGGAGHLTPQESAAKLWARLDEVSMETTGRFLHCDGTQLPW